MLTILFALALTQAPADAPNCTVRAKLPSALAGQWIWPTYQGNQVIAYAAPMRSTNQPYANPYGENNKWGMRPVPGGGYMGRMADDGTLPGMSAATVRGMLDAARANGGILGGGPSVREFVRRHQNDMPQ